MATITVTNLTSTAQWLSDLYATVPANGVLTTSRGVSDVLQLRDLPSKQAAGIVDYTVTYSATDVIAMQESAISTTAQDATVYVDPLLGLDSNPGTSSAPFQTVQAAVNQFVGQVILDQVLIHLNPGNYYVPDSTPFFNVPPFIAAPSPALVHLGGLRFGARPGKVSGALRIEGTWTQDWERPTSLAGPSPDKVTKEPLR